jgi:hydroxymethylpyrimidine/phosphomethylpyrimidine kinase
MSGGTTAVVLTVAGTDSGGAAGIAADVTTFADLGVHGAVVVTAVTAQDTIGVRAVHAVPGAIVLAQLEAVLEDLPVAAVKTGMLATPNVVGLVADRLHHLTVPVVVDPVLVATSGAVLGDAQVARAYLEHLLPVATVITPNADEASSLLGASGSPDRMARALTRLGPAVVLTGGGPAGTCTDWVAVPGEDPVGLTHPAIDTTSDHGTGCTFSAALAVHLAHEVPLIAAVRRAADYTTGQLLLSQSWSLGRGRGPIAHTRIAHTRIAHTRGERA